MKYLPIYSHNTKIMRKVCEPVTFPLSNDTKILIKRMKQWVDDSNTIRIQKKYNLRPAIGIAANQIGSSKRMFYIRVDGLKAFFINPEFIDLSWQKCFLKGGEGCLSVTNQNREIVVRHKFLKIKYYNYLIGKVQIKSFSGIQAIVIQHEIDHLNGIIYLDRAANNNLSVLNDKNNKNFSAVEITY